MTSTVSRATAWLVTYWAAVVARARTEAGRGEIVEKVIIVAAAAAIAIAAMAAISVAVDIKIGNLEL